MALNLHELQALLDQAATAAANDKEIRKSLVRVENLVSNITKELTGIYELLDGATSARQTRKIRTPKAAADIDPEAPYGRRKDGTPKDKPGRGKASEAAE
ncbi:hypothetical protein [Hymenobacter bucti]|uniref:IS66 family transposase n=1 Tax=Hymenobacter bucti TaxID=1844114 RepID=A0ABW4R0X1_9BACT